MVANWNYSKHLNSNTIQRRYLGGDKLDVDLPTELEGYLFSNSFTKIIWLFLNPLFYTLRPMAVNPKPVTGWWLVDCSFGLLRVFSALVIFLRIENCKFKRIKLFFCIVLLLYLNVLEKMYL